MIVRCPVHGTSVRIGIDGRIAKPCAGCVREASCALRTILLKLAP